MTCKEAHKFLEIKQREMTIKRHLYNKQAIEITGLAIEALEKQIPKKGIMIGDNYSSILSCPNCRKPIVNVWSRSEYKPNYCHYCGQKLDWSDTE